jgi:hypothetical protein
MFQWFSTLLAKTVKEEWTTIPMTDEDFEFVNQNPKLQFKFIDRPLCDDVIRYIDGKHESPIEGFYLKAKSVTIRVSKLQGNISGQEKLCVRLRMNYGHYEDFERGDFVFNEYADGIMEMLGKQFCIPESEAPQVVRGRYASMYTYRNHSEIF